MGVFNPHLPQILGQEWVPIRNEGYIPDAFREIGYQLTLTSSRVITSGRFYMDTGLFTQTDFNPAFLMNVYPAGQEVLTGPIERLVIPVDDGAVFDTAALLNATTIQQAMESPDDNSYLTLGSAGWAYFDFDTIRYQAQLFNKRILRINIIGQGYGSFDGNSPEAGGSCDAYFLDDNNIFQFFDQVSFDGTGDLATGSVDPIPFTVQCGEITPYWSTTSTFPTSYQPWRWPVIQRFDFAGASPHIQFVLDTSFITTLPVQITYLAMEIYFCEETRVATGAIDTGNSASVTRGGFGVGMNLVHLRDTSYNYPVTLPAGDYTITFSQADFDS